MPQTHATNEHSSTLGFPDLSKNYKIRIHIDQIHSRQVS